MNARQVYQALINYETNPASPNDGRQVIRDLRLRLHVVLASGDAQQIAAQAAEGERVLRMWQGVP